MIQILAAGSSSGTSTSAGGSFFGLLLPLLLMGAVFYFLLIRPQRNRQRQQQALLNALHVGDEVMTAGGIFGTVTDIDDDHDVITVEIAPGTEVRMIRRAIAQRLTEEPEEQDYSDDDAADEPGEADPEP
jgi:preprotein translocase subunit YajC